MHLSVNRYLRIVIGSLFVVFGVYILWIELLPGSFDPQFKNMMGVVMICYGAYRIVHTCYLRDHQEKSVTEVETKEEQL